MTTTTKTSTGPKALSWSRFSETVDAQLAAHTTPEEVKAAYQAYLADPTYKQAAKAITALPVADRDAAWQQYDTTGTVGYSINRPRAAVNGASPKQAKLIDDLIAQKVHNYTEADVEAAKADWRKTRTMIDFLIAPTTPRKPYQAPAPVVEVPAAPVRARLDFSAIADGNYALPGEGAEIKFYRVSTNGQWKNVQIRASDTLYPAKGKKGIAILHKIVEFGLEKSQMLFATELERCWMCGRSLTHEVSRARGTGDECASK